MKYKTEEERKAARRESQRKWKKKNPDKVAEQNKKYREKNREQILVKKREYANDKYKNDEEYRENAKARNKKRYEENKDIILKQNSEYRKNNKEKIAVSKSEWEKENPKNVRSYYMADNYKQLDRKFNRGECTITAKWILENIFNGQVCHYCGKADWRELGCDRIDNSLPHTPENCVPCCKMCNIKKGTMSYDEYMKKIGKIKCEEVTIE